MALTATITATEHFFRTDEGIPVRLWTGHTASGIPLHVFVAAVDSPDSADQTELQRELHEIPGPQRNPEDLRGISQVRIEP